MHNTEANRWDRAIGGAALQQYCNDTRPGGFVGRLYLSSGSPTVEYDKGHQFSLELDEGRKKVAQIIDHFTQKLESQGKQIHNKVEWVEHTIALRFFLDSLENKLDAQYRPQSRLIETGLKFFGLDNYTSYARNNEEATVEDKLFSSIENLRRKIVKKYNECTSSIKMDPVLDAFFTNDRNCKLEDYSSLEERVVSQSNQLKQNLQIIAQKQMELEVQKRQEQREEKKQYVMTLGLIACAVVAGAFLSSGKNR